MRLKLLGQRTLVAVLGLVTVWLILVLFYDVADRRLPLVLALASTYAVAAYLILPRAIGNFCSQKIYPPHRIVEIEVKQELV